MVGECPTDHNGIPGAGTCPECKMHCTAGHNPEGADTLDSGVCFDDKCTLHVEGSPDGS